MIKKKKCYGKVLEKGSLVSSDEEFLEFIIDKVKEALNTQYLRKRENGEYDEGYPTQMLQYDCTRDDAKITIPESIGFILLHIENLR
ncbi:hypothetical protein, partial [Wolbachia endosymbiont of Pentidionis agamae]|uniref:hypothetical protein n=1 Tax=Wolbachia endosymbiont of Pentidionis agamae TaxID=3110435 RepID=UPI002FD1B71C